MRKATFRILVGIAGFLGAAFVVYGPTTVPTNASIRPAAALQAASTPPLIQLASPGRIEGRSDIMEIGAGVDGVLQSVLVHEGQAVTKGQIVAQLDCQDLQSTLPVAKAEAESLRQARARLLRGSRQEERDAAAEHTAASKAVLDQTAAQYDRIKDLADAGEISRASLDSARRDHDVAAAEYERARRNEALVNAGPLAEEVAKADADLNAANERIQLAQEKLNKCVVRAPIAGTVLQIFLRKGESFAVASPRPILTMADITGRRVRAEVDERDVGKVHVGQPVLITSAAYAGRSFKGTVTRLAPVMGKKSVLTGDPADKSDRDVLEITAQLEPRAKALPVGLRVTVEFGN